MNIESINTDIALLKSAVDLISKTKNSIHFCKGACLVTVLGEIQNLETKRDKQIEFVKSINKSVSNWS